jgi:hypothetical protein
MKFRSIIGAESDVVKNRFITAVKRSTNINGLTDFMSTENLIPDTAIKNAVNESERSALNSVFAIRTITRYSMRITILILGSVR